MKNLIDVSGNLDTTHLASGIHPGSLVDRVSPHVEDGLTSSNDSTHQWSATDA